MHFLRKYRGFAKIRLLMNITRDKILFLWGLSIVLLIVTFAAVYYKIHSGPQLIALHYNVIVGVDLVAGKNSLFKVPLTGLVIGVVNYFLPRLIKFEPEFLSFLAGLVTVLIQLLLLASVIFLFRVN
jgi:hypothetical protein